MGNASDSEILATLEADRRNDQKRRDDDVLAAGFVRLTTASSRWTPDKISGWKLHIVPGGLSDSPNTLGKRAAICGVRPAHGWDVDLFIDTECERCAKAFSALQAEQGAK